VTYVIEVPPTPEEYIARHFRAGKRSGPRRLLRDVPKRYRLAIDPGVRKLAAFHDLYRRTIVARPRGRDRLAEHGGRFGGDWAGLYLFDGDAMVAGVLAHRRARHLSVGYGAFDPGHGDLDLEHYLLMEAMKRARELGCPTLSLGMDTNRYGHHLSLGLAPYKLRLGFTPRPHEPGGRELVRVQRFDAFEEGLFFYAYADAGLEGHLFTRGEPGLRAFAHAAAPPVRAHRIAGGS
jgi:hypothetical protein